MLFKNRCEQFSFLYGSVIAKRGRELLYAERVMERSLGGDLTTDMIFCFCPFNDSFEHLLGLYELKKNSNPKYFENFCFRFIEEFFVLYANSVPKCCGDGRLAYGLSETDDEIVQICDRCDQIYSLSGEEISRNSVRYLTRRDFTNRFGDSDQDWPYVEKVITKIASRVMSR